MAERAPEIEQDLRDWLGGHDTFTRVHADADVLRADVESVDAYREGTVAWGAVRARIPVGEGHLAVRLSVVLHQEGAGWKLVQTHASIGGRGDA